jgi:hypothetical protein
LTVFGRTTRLRGKNGATPDLKARPKTNQA